MGRFCDGERPRLVEFGNVLQVLDDQTMTASLPGIKL